MLSPDDKVQEQIEDAQTEIVTVSTANAPTITIKKTSLQLDYY